MVNLKTKFIGLELKSPIIAGSCGLTSEVSKIEEMERAYRMHVPLRADCGWGKNWLEAH